VLPNFDTTLASFIVLSELLAKISQRERERGRERKALVDGDIKMQESRQFKKFLLSVF
jgi:hypothetical protein